MKKSRVIALTLVVALMLMGTAYAAWTQTINVNSTVETGELYVNLLNNSGIRGRIHGDTQGVNTSGLAIVNATNTEDDNTKNVVLTGGNFFPKTEYWAHLKLINEGSIPADINVGSFEYLVGEGYDLLEESDDVTYRIELYHSLSNDMYAGDEVFDKTYESLEDLIDDFSQTLETDSLTLEVGEYAHMRFYITFSEDADEETLPEDMNFGFSFNFEVSQFNID